MRRHTTKSNQPNGFTFMEVLLVIGIFGLLGVLAMPFYQTFHVQSLLDSTTAEILSALRAAQLSAMVGTNDAAHGVHIEAQQFVVFQGTSYTAENLNNFVTPLPPSLQLNSSFGGNIVYTQVTGIPDVTGTITISSNSTTHALAINAHGTVDQTN